MRIPISYNMQIRNLFGVLINIYIWIFWINTDFNITSCSMLVWGELGYAEWELAASSYSLYSSLAWILRTLGSVTNLQQNNRGPPLVFFFAILSCPKSCLPSAPYLTCHFLLHIPMLFQAFLYLFCPFDLNQIIIFHWCINCSHLYMTNVILWLPLSFSLLRLICSSFVYFLWTSDMYVEPN